MSTIRNRLAISRRCKCKADHTLEVVEDAYSRRSHSAQHAAMVSTTTTLALSQIDRFTCLASMKAQIAKKEILLLYRLNEGSSADFALQEEHKTILSYTQTMAQPSSMHNHGTHLTRPTISTIQQSDSYDTRNGRTKERDPPEEHLLGRGM
jgi:hypothetical protein